MKRQLSILLAFAMLLALLPARLSAAQGDESWRVATILETDFESGVPDAIKVNMGEKTTAEVDATKGKSMIFSGQMVRFGKQGNWPVYVLEMDIRHSSLTQDMPICFENGWTNGPMFTTKGQLQADGKSMAYEENHWYRLKLALNIKTRTYDLSVDGTPFAENVAVGNVNNFINIVLNNWSTDVTCAIDNVHFYGYVPPSAYAVELTAPSAGEALTVGDRVTLSAEVSAQTDPALEASSVRFYANDTLVESKTAAPYECSYLLSTPGDLTIYSEVEDASGGVTRSEPVVVTVENAVLPEVAFAELADGGDYEKSTLTAVGINASVGEGRTIDRVELYVGGRLFATAEQEPYSFDLSGLPYGAAPLTARAVTNENRIAEANAAITIRPRRTANEIFESDLESGMPSAIQLVPNDGRAAYPVEIDAAHGKSIECGATTNSAGYVQINASGDALYAFEADLYLSDTNVGVSSNICGDERGEGPSFENGTVSLYKGAQRQTVAEFEGGNWYRLRLEFDTVNQTYSFYWQGEKVASDWPMQKTAKNFWALRFFYWAKSGFYALDNMRFETITYAPYIKDVPGPVAHDAETVTLTLSASALASTVTDQNVRLLCGGEPVELAGVEYQPGSVVLYPRYELYSNQEYEAVLGEGVADAGGVPIGAPESFRFATAAKPLDVAEAGFAERGGKLTFTARVKNEEAAERSFTLVVNIWQGGELMRSTAKPCTLPAGRTDSFSSAELELGVSERAEAFVITGLDAPEGVSSKVFEFTK